MIKSTAHSEQLKQMDAIEDDRRQAANGWEKLPLFWFLL